MSESNRGSPIALLGYSVEAMAAAKALGYRFVSVVPPGFETYVPEGTPTVTWRFDHVSDRSGELLESLEALGVRLAVPLYEECVEWAGELNTSFLQDPRRFAKVMLLRDKAMMKRKAQMSGIRVGAFQEVENAAELRKFFRRVNEAAARIPGDEPEPVHVKPLRAAGSVGHRFIRRPQQIAEIPDDGYPLLAESHLGGQEFSVEAFVHDGRIWFMNLNEYVHLGYTQHTPAGPKLEAMRPAIRKQVEKLIKAFDIRYGVIHPEYFVDDEGEIAFGEVANRVPGGNIFELIGRAYGFDPYQGLMLASDPEVTADELERFFPDETAGRQGYAGNCLVFPRAQRVESLRVTEELTTHPYFERHTMFEPIPHDVGERTGFGNHYGTIFFFGDDPDRMRQTLDHFEQAEFYV